MTDSLITNLDEQTTPLITDLMVTEDDPTGTPNTEKMRLDTYLKIINGLTELAVAATASGDELALYDITASGAKKVTIDTLFRHFARTVEIPVFGWTTDHATGDGKAYLHVAPVLDGLNLTYCHARLITAGVTATLDIQIYNLTQTADMLSTVITVDTTETGSETAATPYVIDAANDDVAENDVIRIDIDAIHSGTAGKGLLLTLGFS